MWEPDQPVELTCGCVMDVVNQLDNRKFVRMCAACKAKTRIVNRRPDKIDEYNDWLQDHIESGSSYRKQ